jgi:hypothetical protein
MDKKIANFGARVWEDLTTRYSFSDSGAFSGGLGGGWSNQQRQQAQLQSLLTGQGQLMDNWPKLISSPPKKPDPPPKSRPHSRTQYGMKRYY